MLRSIMEALTDDELRRQMEEASNIFRVLIKTLLQAGIITPRTTPRYAAFVDMKELHNEGEEMVGDSIAAQRIDFLKTINAGPNPLLSRPSVSAK